MARKPQPPKPASDKPASPSDIPADFNFDDMDSGFIAPPESDDSGLSADNDNDDADDGIPTFEFEMEIDPEIEAAEQEALAELAQEWTPDAVNCNTVREYAESHNYNCVTSARIINEEYTDYVDEDTVDAMAAALLMVGVSNREDIVPLVSAQTLEIYDELMETLADREDETREEPEILSEAPQMARRLLLASFIADLEILAEDAEDGYDPEEEDIIYCAACIASVTAKGDLEQRLVQRACDALNTLSGIIDCPLWLNRASDNVADIHGWPPEPKADKKPKGPKPPSF